MDDELEGVHANRQAILDSLYDKAEGQREPIGIADIPARGASDAEVAAAVSFLRDAKLIEKSGLGSDIQLTHAGIVDVEKRRSELIFGMNSASWIRIDSHFLEPYKDNRSTEDAIAYIDGRRPDWGDCLPSVTPRRGVALGILKDLTSLAGGQAYRPRLWAILGATGEGKSTSLMQVIVDIALLEGPFVVLWRKVKGRLSADEIAKLPKDRIYLIGSDDGEEVAGEILEAMQKTGRTDVHYCIAATTTEWQRVGARAMPWKSYSQFDEKQLRGLDQADAELIVRVWEQHGKQGLRELAKEPDTTARATALVDATKKEASHTEGAFFGGMLRVRYGEYLKDHIRELLGKLVGRKLQDGVPYPQIYMLIAAAHSTQLLLTPEILATAVGLEATTVRSVAIDPLSDEAVVSMAGGYVYMRHRLIAVASLELAESRGMSIPELYTSLVRSAIIVGRRKFVDGFSDYVRLPRHFEKTRLDVAIALAEMINVEMPDKLTNIHSLGRVLLLAGRLEAASATYQRASSRLDSMTDGDHRLGQVRRIYYFEWGHVEYKLENYAISCWLKAISIADLDSEKRPVVYRLSETPQDHLERTLTSISANLLQLHQRTANGEFLETANGVIVLTRRLTLSAVGDRVQKAVEDRVAGLSLAPVSDIAAKLLFREGVRLAFENRERELPALPDGRELEFSQLFARLGL
ncbi:P-loop NTPase [Paractinoplanes globisporus]|uniref:Novel STAND NTPase 5 domain-containing protein n=1 Tax=Paractinoplanes globisporus TaxID=113565 RepID=A0ABW6W7I6_9ACTN|nr:hypothetical protein [Actinoplanes globisporus]